MFRGNSITRRISDCDVAAPRQHISCLPASEHQRGEIPARRCRNRESRFSSSRRLGSLLTVVRASLLSSARCAASSRASSRHERGNGTSHTTNNNANDGSREIKYSFTNGRRRPPYRNTFSVARGCGTHSCIRYQDAIRDLIIPRRASDQIERFVTREGVTRPFYFFIVRGEFARCHAMTVRHRVISKMTIGNQIRTFCGSFSSIQVGSCLPGLTWLINCVSVFFLFLLSWNCEERN